MSGSQTVSHLRAPKRRKSWEIYNFTRKMLSQFTLICMLVCSVAAVSEHPILIVVSYDAFRYNFFDSEHLPNMELFRNKGTHAEYIVNVFPTKTFPNHHSIATGVFPEVHGVIGNSYYDEKERRVIKMSPKLYDYNKNVIPIWRWNEDQDATRHSGSVMWPGAVFPYQGKNITHMMDFKAGYDWRKRVDIAIDWILDTDRPANLVMLYFEEPDTHGHGLGPNSPVIKDLLQKLDNITGYLQQKLFKHNLLDNVNVVHLSDHGMLAVTPPFFINITHYMQNGTYEMCGASPVLQIWPHDGYQDTIYNALKQASYKNRHFSVYRKEEFPERWHYGNTDRSPPILVMADPGYALDDLILAAPQYAKAFDFTLTNNSEFGVHGYDYLVPEMRPFFMANGPKIKQKNKVSPFSNLNLFNLFCAILEIPKTQNNGSSELVYDILTVTAHGKYSTGTILMISVGGVIITLVLIALAVVFTLIVIKRQQSITTTAALNKRFPQTFANYIEAQHLLEPEPEA